MVDGGRDDGAEVGPDEDDNDLVGLNCSEKPAARMPATEGAWARAGGIAAAAAEAEAEDGAAEASSEVALVGGASRGKMRN